MTGAAALLMALGLVFPTLVAEHDIPWFVERPQVRAETLRRCHDDIRLARTDICRNAEKAGSRTIGQPLAPQAEGPHRQQPAPPAAPESPSILNKGTDRAA
jgi:hypothetical protein